MATGVGGLRPVFKSQQVSSIDDFGCENNRCIYTYNYAIVFLLQSNSKSTLYLSSSPKHLQHFVVSVASVGRLCDYRKPYKFTTITL